MNDFIAVDEPYIKLENVTASWSSSKLKVGLIKFAISFFYKNQVVFLLFF